MLLYITFPKDLYHKEAGGLVVSCDCLGSDFWFGAKCIGIPISCTTEQLMQEESLCEEKTCEQVMDILSQRSNDYEGVEALMDKTSKGTDVILLIDASNSMDGEKLITAKQAAQRVVNELESGERIAVIAFSESAVLVHNFSADKRSLTEGITSLTISGGTKYLPALELAAELFVEQANNARQGMIFLSDGTPSDDPVAIVQETKTLLKKNISLFVINFGIQDEDSNIILKQMVSDEEGSTERWYRAFTDTQSIADAFFEAWEEITQVKVISLLPTFDFERVGTKGLGSIGVQARLIDVILTTDKEAGLLCDPQISVKMTATDISTNLTTTHELSSFYDEFSLSVGSLIPGTYELEAHAEYKTNHQQSCLFTGDATLGTMTIIEEQSACDRTTCEFVREILYDEQLAYEEEIFLPREIVSGRVAMLIDTSESMQPHLPAVVATANRLNRLLSSSDQRALIGFANEAKLHVPLTTNREKFEEGLNDLRGSGTTRLIPALKKVDLLFKEHWTQDVAVIITDGLPYDQGGNEAILEEVDKLVKKDVCIFVVGYGTQILRNKESDILFRQIAKHSIKEAGCGGYAFAPDQKELSRIVIEMFGQVIPAKGDVRVALNAPTEVVFPQRVLVDAHVVSTETSLRLPVMREDLCLPAPVVTLTLLAGQEVLYSYEENLQKDSFSKMLPTLMPGKYTLVVDATLPVEGCDFTATTSQELVIRGMRTTVTEWLIMMCIIVLVLAVLYSGLQVFRKL